MRLPGFRRGRAAERVAARALRRRGYRIVERNIRLGHDEIDLVAVHDEHVVIVEVRYRSRGLGFAAESVNARKRDAIRRAAAAYRRQERLTGVPMRVDLVFVTRADGKWKVQVIESAFEM